jgi:hypothetical protein
MIGMSFSPLIGSVDLFFGFSISLFVCGIIAAYGDHITFRH